MQAEHVMGAIAALIEHNLYTPEAEEELQEMVDEYSEPVEVDGDPQKYAEVQKMIRGLTAGKLGVKKSEKSYQFSKAGYSDSEPRDEDGKWTAGAGGGGPGGEGGGIVAKKGGIVIGGQYFHSGEKIPDEVHKNASEDEKLEISSDTQWGFRGHQSKIQKHMKDNLVGADEERAKVVRDSANENHKKLIDSRYNNVVKQLDGIDPEGKYKEKVAEKYKEIHEYFVNRAEGESGKRGGWRQDDIDKKIKSIDWLVGQAKKEAAGQGPVKWPEGKSEHHDKIISMVRSEINKSKHLAIHATGLRKQASTAIGNMSEKAAQSLSSKLKSVVFENSSNAVTRIWDNKHANPAETKKFKEKWGGVAGFAGGGSMTVGPGDGIFAHEAVHVLDGPISGSESRKSGVLSGHSEWLDAWKSEIDIESSPLNKYSQINPAEGLAEFGRMIWSGHDVAEISSKFPKSYGFWKKHVDGE